MPEADSTAELLTGLPITDAWIDEWESRVPKSKTEETHRRQLLYRLARCSKDGEVLDDGNEFVMSNDDAVDTLHTFIDTARDLLGIENPPMAQSDDVCPNCSQTREEHEDAGLAFGDDCDREDEATEE